MNEKSYNYPAIKVRYPVTLLTAEGHVHGETRLLNNRGALIRCHQPPRLHETATISIDISEDETLMVEAEVVRLEFYELDDNEHDQQPVVEHHGCRVSLLVGDLIRVNPA